MPKVKKLKKKTKYSYYKGVKSIKKNGKPNWGKIKYQYGIKLIWSKVKNAKGYEVYRYENAKGCWTKIKTVKKPTYTLTNMLEGEKVKIKVRAYKKTKNGNEYGKYSDVLSFTTKNMYTKIYKNGKTKGFFSKWASEDAFVIQNDMRVKVGAKPLKWSDRIYEIASLRAYMMATKDGLTHAGEWRDEKSILTVSTLLNDYYGVSDAYLSVPTILGKNGIEKVFNIQLSKEEQEKFVSSANLMKQYIDRINDK